LIRGALLDSLGGVIGDLIPGAAFDEDSWTTEVSSTSPLFRGLSGANPEDVFTGSYSEEVEAPE
jgi:hypothetical protein